MGIACDNSCIDVDLHALVLQPPDSLQLNVQVSVHSVQLHLQILAVLLELAAFTDDNVLRW